MLTCPAKPRITKITQHSGNGLKQQATDDKQNAQCLPERYDAEVAKTAGCYLKKCPLFLHASYMRECAGIFGGTPLLMSCCARKQQGMNSWHKNAGRLSSQKGHGMKRLRISLVPRPTVCTPDKYRLFLY